MVNKYTRAKKEKLIEQINKLEQKIDFIKIFGIIKSNEDILTKETSDSILMFFHDLKHETYEEIDNFLKTKKNNENGSDDNVQEYKPYAQDDFPGNKHISPKLKYSNRERNLIKRTKYDKDLEQENGTDIMYCKFNVENLTETEANSTEDQDTENNFEVSINETMKDI